MSNPDGPDAPDATRRALVRGAVVLGAVGVGAGLSRLGEGTYDLASTETDTATQAPAPEATTSAEPSATAKPTKKATPSKSAKPTKKAEPAASSKPTKKAEPAASAKPTKKAEPKPAGKELGPANKVPVGGGAIYKSDRVVVTQPKAGEFKAFDAMCTHANCLVDEVKDNVIHCPCHSARFSIADGSVVKPSVARRPLAPKGTVTESGGKLYLA